MALLRAYADESGKASDVNAKCISFAGVMGTTEQWKKFNRSWGRFLVRKRIPYLHVKEVIRGRRTGKGPFAQFADSGLFARLLIDAATCIISAGLYCRGTSIFVDDLRRVIARHKLTADPYSFTLYQAVISLGTVALNGYPDEPAFHLILDRLEQPTKRLAEAEQLFETDRFNSWRGWPAVTALRPKDRDGSREIVELQAADLVAWVLRRELLYIEEWMRTVKPHLTSDQSQWNDSLSQWLHDRVKQDSAEKAERYLAVYVWDLLHKAKLLKHYPYDEERLENHVIRGRTLECDPALKARTIRRAGNFPLTP
jgi:hypothetical protein